MPDTVPEILPYHELQVRFRKATSDQERTEILLGWTIETYKSDLEERSRQREYRKEVRAALLDLNSKLEKAATQESVNALAETLGRVLTALSDGQRQDKEQDEALQKLGRKLTVVKAAKYIAGGSGFLLGSHLVHELLKALLEALLK